MMLEADVVLGKLANGSTTEDIPIMGHPPANTSDLSLEDFLNKVSSYNNGSSSVSKKGIKLDFKTIEVFSKSATLLTTLYPSVSVDFVRSQFLMSGLLDQLSLVVECGYFARTSKCNNNSSKPYTISCFSKTVYKFYTIDRLDN